MICGPDPPPAGRLGAVEAPPADAGALAVATATGPASAGTRKGRGRNAIAVEAARIAPGVAAYSKAARAWWIEDHCHVAAALHEGNFAGDLAQLTGAMKGLFASQLGATPGQAQKQVQQIQVFALEQMTSAKFYDCGGQAKAVFQEGYGVTERIAATARERAAKPR